MGVLCPGTGYPSPGHGTLGVNMSRGGCPDKGYNNIRSASGQYVCYLNDFL